MLKVHRFIFNPFAENCYLVWDTESSEGIVIDPGCFDDTEKLEISNFIDLNNIKLKYLINTHCHIDHIFGSCYIKSNFNVVYFAPQEDLPLLRQASQQASMFGMELRDICMPDNYINSELKLLIGNISFSFIFTPGHTPGGYCLYFKDQDVCFSGDVLFQSSIGRTDLPGGDFDQIIESIQEKLFTLPDNTIVYPGHGESTTIGIEKKANPFFN